MNIKDLMEKYKDAPADRILVRDLLVEAKIVHVPEENLKSYIILEDDSSKLEAVTIKRTVLDFLKHCVGNNKSFKLKGRLDKTEYGNIAFEIEEILE